MAAEKKETFLAIDANAIIHRAFHAFPPNLVNSKGLQVNAVYGFTSMLLRVLDEFDPKYIVCAFDTKKPTFRHIKYTEYKAHRKPTDHSLIAQFPIVEEVLNAFNIPIIKKEGFEADDILGSISKLINSGKWQGYGLELILLSGDRDLLQLIGGRTKVCLPVGSFKTLQLYDDLETFKKFGMYPNQVVDYKALVGDASDNIPGVKGIGEKSAIDLLKKYKSFENIYKHTAELTPRLQKLLSEGVEQAQFSRELATIDQDVELGVKIESCLMKDFDRSKVIEIFKELEFRSLLSKIPESVNDTASVGGQLDMFGMPVHKDENGNTQPSFGPDKYSVKPIEKLTSSQIREIVGLWDGLNDPTLMYMRSKESSLGELVAFGGVDNSGMLCIFYGDPAGSKTQELLSSFTSTVGCETYSYGWEYYVSRMLRIDSKLVSGLSVVNDIELLCCLLSSGEKGYLMSDLLFKYFGVQFGGVTSEAELVVAFWAVKKIWDAALEHVDDRQEKVNSLHTVEVPVAVILAKMEQRGIAMDHKLLLESAQELDNRIRELCKAIYQCVGHEFNLNSPKQLGELLFDELNLPAGRGKSGRSTREEVLKKLSPYHPVISLVLEYRELSKVKSTYLDVYCELAKQYPNDSDIEIHTDFEQKGASSGRFSSHDPNLQNIPARGTMAKVIRSLFIPRPGYKLISVDYSQIEFRFMAHFSEDKALLDDFKNDKDIHLNTAMRVFGKKAEEVSSDLRSFGKTINFGILYGQSRYGLAPMLNTTHDEAGKLIDQYFETYSGVAEYIKEAKKIAQERGYAETILGRRRYISGLNSPNYAVREASIREAINMPIQGSAADLMKLAMIEVDRHIESKYNGRAYILLQIHDELVLEAEAEIADQFMGEIKALLEGAMKLNVPLKASASVGDNLAEIK